MRRALRSLAIMLIAAGTGLLGRDLYFLAKAEVASHLIRNAWATTQETGRPTRPWPWADTHPVARLVIPSIGYDEIVLEGAAPRTLAFGPGRMESGAEPAEAGNLILAGHRTSWFRKLEHVSAGARVLLQALARMAVSPSGPSSWSVSPSSAPRTDASSGRRPTTRSRS